MIDSTAADDDSVVGDECHIVSGKSEGPRHTQAFPPESADAPENLILLCRVHHKMVDDQSEIYTVEILQKFKVKHEKWVSSTLAEYKQPSSPKIRRIKENIPSHLIRLTSGKDIMNVVGNASAFLFDHDEPHTEAEVDLLSGFLQEIQDWGDLSSDLDAGARVRAAHRISQLIGELDQAGFWVFGAIEVRLLDGGIGPPSDFPIAIVKALRATNSEITSVDLSAASETKASQVPYQRL